MEDPIRFAALCHVCEREVDQGTFPLDCLRDFLREHTLQFYCPHCNAEWAPSEQELQSIALLVHEPLMTVG